MDGHAVADAHITITYAAVVTYPVPGSSIPSPLVNTAYIAVPGYAEVQRTATLQTHLYRVYLPLVMRR